MRDGPTTDYSQCEEVQEFAVRCPSRSLKRVRSSYRERVNQAGKAERTNGWEARGMALGKVIVRSRNLFVA